MSIEELIYFKEKDNNAWKETSYWLGTPKKNVENVNHTSFIFYVESGGYYGSSLYSYNNRYGIRPVIVI